MPISRSRQSSFRQREHVDRKLQFKEILAWLARAIVDGDDEYPDLPRGSPLPVSAHGFRREWAGREFLAIPVDLLDQHIEEGLRRWTKRELVRKGYLVVGADGKLSRQIRLFGESGRRRWLTFDVEALNRVRSD